MREAVAIGKEAWRLVRERGPFLASVGSLIAAGVCFFQANRMDAVVERTAAPSRFQAEMKATRRRATGYAFLAAPIVLALARIDLARRKRDEDDPLFGRL